MISLLSPPSSSNRSSPTIPYLSLHQLFSLTAKVIIKNCCEKTISFDDLEEEGLKMEETNMRV